MKKMFLLGLFLTVLLGLSSCSKDDDKVPQNNNELIVGNWKVMVLDTHVYQNNTLITENIGYQAHEHADMLLNFKADKTMTYYLKNLDDSNAEVINQTGVYSINGNILTFTLNNETKVVKINNISNSNMKVQYGPEEFEENGEKYTRTTYFYLNRQ